MLIDDGSYKECPLYINTDLVVFAYLDKRDNIYSNKNIVIEMGDGGGMGLEDEYFDRFLNHKDFIKGDEAYYGDVAMNVKLITRCITHTTSGLGAIEYGTMVRFAYTNTVVILKEDLRHFVKRLEAFKEKNK